MSGSRASALALLPAAASASGAAAPAPAGKVSGNSNNNAAAGGVSGGNNAAAPNAVVAEGTSRNTEDGTACAERAAQPMATAGAAQPRTLAWKHHPGFKIKKKTL